MKYFAAVVPLKDGSESDTPVKIFRYGGNGGALCHLTRQEALELVESLIPLLDSPGDIFDVQHACLKALGEA